jgi:hypothetical protein
MNKITLSIAAAVLATGIATGASAATAPTAPATTGITFQAPKVPATQQASYFYRYRCYYVRYGYRVYRRCYIRYYYY